MDSTAISSMTLPTSPSSPLRLATPHRRRLRWRRHHVLWRHQAGQLGDLPRRCQRDLGYGGWFLRISMDLSMGFYWFRLIFLRTSMSDYEFVWVSMNFQFIPIGFYRFRWFSMSISIGQTRQEFIPQPKKEGMWWKLINRNNIAGYVYKTL